MLILSLSYFFIGSRFNNSFNIIWYSCIFALILNIPPKLDKESLKEVDNGYKELDIKNGNLKYKIGLVFYLVGFIIGWILFYGEIHTIN